jgi:hypothetical protein
MQRVQKEVGTKPSIVIRGIGGDLRVSGREGDQIEVVAPEKGELSVEEIDQGVEIACRSGCLLFVPLQAQIDVDMVGGDGRLTDVQGEVLIKTIGGDLSLRRLGKASLERVGGDVQVREIEGDLMIDHVGGDGIIRDVKGNVHLRMVGGDFILGEVSGSVEVMVGGDAVLNLLAEPDTQTTAQTGGDLSCQIPDEASAVMNLQAGGDVHLPNEAEEVSSHKEGQAQVYAFTLGGGNAQISLQSGGDLNLQYGHSSETFDASFVGDILTEVDAKLAEMEARFNAMGAGMASFDADRIGERVRRSVRQAQKRAERAARKAEEKARKSHRKHLKFNFDMDGEWPDLRFADFSQPGPDISDEERLAILRMVEDGKLSVDEAEALLKALEGES